MVVVADIEVKDGTILKKCCIFNEGTKGEPALNNKEAVTSKLQKYPWGNEWNTVFFQTRYMNGYIPVENIAEYSVYEIEEW